MVSCYDHAAGRVARPTVLLDKGTYDAHDNPVLTVDARGHLWVFSTSHGTSRPSYISRSVRPYDIDRFESVEATLTREDGTVVPFRNFSYMQIHPGFTGFYTHYDDPVERTLFFLSSPDGRAWRERRLAAIDAGHYQVSAVRDRVAATAFNVHPHGYPIPLNWRTNLYYMETRDHGDTWQAADGTSLALPLTATQNRALVRDYAAEKLNVYLKDIGFDADGRPVILYITSKGYASGPANDPRTWTTARWTGRDWDIRPAMTSDSNYDMGSLYLEAPDRWRIIAPTEPGPQPYNPGGEVALWLSSDRGGTWRKTRDLTRNSPRNHTYVRRPVHAHPDFYAFWADGHARQPSVSRLYFADRDGHVHPLPARMGAEPSG
jgi:hypothetical protein